MIVHTEINTPSVCEKTKFVNIEKAKHSQNRLSQNHGSPNKVPILKTFDIPQKENSTINFAKLISDNLSYPDVKIEETRYGDLG